MLLLFELHLDAKRVPHLDGDADHDRSAQADKNLDPGLFGDESEELLGKACMDPVAASFGGNDEEEQQELAVDARAAENAFHPAIEAEIDEGCEGPDFVGFDKAAEDTGKECDRNVEGQREVLGMEDCGYSEYGCAERGPARADQKAEKDDGLERDVGGEEIGDGGTYPDTKGKWDEEKGEQGKSLLGTAFFREEKGRKVAARASTLATDATTPSLTSRVMRMSLSVTSSVYGAGAVWQRRSREWAILTIPDSDCSPHTESAQSFLLTVE